MRFIPANGPWNWSRRSNSGGGAEPDTNVLRAALEKFRELEAQRRGLLTGLLGTNWETGDLVSLPRPSRPGVALDGPVLGALSSEVKQALQNVGTSSQDRMQAYLDAQRSANSAPDPVELAKLRQQTRDELARVLSPPELEEFLLRYSQDANDLRTEFGQLRYFNPTPDEFRGVFRATDALDQRIQLLADATDPGSVDARKALEDQRENAIKLALGPEALRGISHAPRPGLSGRHGGSATSRHAGCGPDDLCD